MSEPQVVTTTTKPWYKSKTIWWNIISGVVDVAGSTVGIPPKTATMITIVGNLVLRFFTKKPITAT